MEGRRGDVRRPDETRALIAGLVIARLPAPGPRLLSWSLVAAWGLLGAVPAPTRQLQAGGCPFRFVAVSAPSHLTPELPAGGPATDHLPDPAGPGTPFLASAKVGILTASAFAGIAGATIVRSGLRR